MSRRCWAILLAVAIIADALILAPAVAPSCYHWALAGLASAAAFCTITVGGWLLYKQGRRDYRRDALQALRESRAPSGD